MASQTLTQDQGVPNCILPSHNSHSHSHPPQTPQNVNQEKLTEINISQEQRKKGGGESPPQDAARVQRGADKDPSHSSAGERGHSLQLRNLGYDRMTPRKIQGDLEDRCRTGRGLGVSLLRLWPGERLSPRWPLREPRSLLCWSRGEGWGEGRRRSAGE